MDLENSVSLIFCYGCRHAFATMSFISETFIFLYVGMDALDIDKWRESNSRYVHFLVRREFYVLAKNCSHHLCLIKYGLKNLTNQTMP